MSIQSEINRINTAVSDQETLIGEIATALAARCVITEPILQSKTVTPSEEVQTVTPDAGYDGLSSVTVEAAQGGEGTYGWKKCVSGLPSGYTEVEYIQSSGTQYINAGFKPNQNTKVVADAEWLDSANYPMLFGVYESTTTQFAVYYQANWHAWVGGKELTITGGYQGRKSVSLDNALFVVSGTSTTTGGGSFSATAPMYIFALNHAAAGSALYHSSIRLYSLQVYDNGTLVRYFVPCKNASGAAGLYDIVNDVFYGNAGSGTFAVGSTASKPSVINVIGYAVSDDADTYPNGAFLDGYYYEKL